MKNIGKQKWMKKKKINVQREILYNDWRGVLIKKKKLFKWKKYIKFLEKKSYNKKE